ncbi:MAG TPA: hypothetical protein PLW50_00935 [Smithellaceae bacterium]|nr:hypothetical protein [Smithellaceae bacterium]
MAQKFDADPNHIIPESAKQTDTNLLELANQINLKNQVTQPAPAWGISAASDVGKVLRAASNIPRRAWDASRNIEKDIASVPQFAAAAALNYLSGGAANDIVDAAGRNLEERAKRYGIGVPSAQAATPAAVTTPPASVVQPPAKPTMELTDEATLRASVGAPANGGPKNRNDELYAAINALDDKRFVQFMKDNPTIPGVGYVKGNDGRMVRFAENPDRKKREPMSPIEMEGVGKTLAGMGHLQAGIGSREHAAQVGRVADMEKARMNDEKLLLDFQNNKLPANSPILAYGPDNKPIHATELGLLKMMDDGKKVHPEYADQAASLLREREGHIKAEMDKDYVTSKGKEPQYDISQKDNLKSAFAKKRWSLIKEWEARKLQSLKSKVQTY